MAKDTAMRMTVEERVVWKELQGLAGYKFGGSIPGCWEWLKAGREEGEGEPEGEPYRDDLDELVDT